MKRDNFDLGRQMALLGCHGSPKSVWVWVG
jgi:hypothetical protein